MLRQNTNALGIIFPNSYDNTVPELVTERAMASIPFAGRYRMVDFVLSSMANCGISNVSIVVRKNYHSLMDHLGTGREWDMARRHGGLNIVPPFAEKGVRIYSGRVEALGSILSFLEHQKEKYVVMSDANIIQDEIYNAVKEIATQNGYAAVVDRASASSIIFASPSIDVSNEVLAKLGYSN